MNDELFTELLQSVRKGGAIIRGEKEPSRKFVVEAPDVKRIRERCQLSQSETETTKARPGCQQPGRDDEEVS